MSGRRRPQTSRLPDAGVLRVHHDPAALPRYEGTVGPHRFDDPRPNSLDRYVMRYAASTLRGCLLELLAWLRPNDQAAEREADVVDELAPVVAHEPDQAMAQYLNNRYVGTIIGPDLRLVSINDPDMQAELDRAAAVRALLDSPDGRAALLTADTRPSRRAHLDQAAVRLSSDLGRDLTRACSLALRDRADRPDGIHYRSRHDDAEDCWAIYDHATVEITVIPLSPTVQSHRAALRDVATMWNLKVPAGWQ